MNKPFENVSCQGPIHNFFQGGGTNFCLFSSVFFSTDLILSNLSNKNDSWGVRGHALRKMFENSHVAMAILVLFEQFLRKLCHIFGP